VISDTYGLKSNSFHNLQYRTQWEISVKFVEMKHINWRADTTPLTIINYFMFFLQRGRNHCFLWNQMQFMSFAAYQLHQVLPQSTGSVSKELKCNSVYNHSILQSAFNQTYMYSIQMILLSKMYNYSMVCQNRTAPMLETVRVHMLLKLQ
jgi:hypothetical protein